MPDGERKTIDLLLEECRQRLERLSPDEALGAMAEGATLIDIRSEIQRERDGVIPGAHFIPRNVLEWRLDPASGYNDPALGDSLDRPLILVCDEGFQSSLAAAELLDLGFGRATDIEGGFQAWRAAGLAVGPCTQRTSRA